jgi:hypothetical protein
MSKSTETRAIDIHGEGIVGGNQRIESHIKFFVTDKQRIVDISLNYIGFRLMTGIRPLIDISNFSKKKDTLTLTLTNLYQEINYRFHYPDSFIICPFELLEEYRIFRR